MIKPDEIYVGLQFVDSDNDIGTIVAVDHDKGRITVDYPFERHTFKIDGGIMKHARKLLDPIDVLIEAVDES